MMVMGIMAPAISVDVRDMLCAQALAVVAQAMEGLKAAEAAEVLYNAEDVRRDLLVWAQDRGYPAREAGVRVLRIERRDGSGPR